MNTLDGREHVGRYRLLGFLGSGAMGEVYLAEDPHIERKLAIKTVRLVGRPEEIEDRKKRLLREARAFGRLLHPNIVTLFDAGEADGLLFLAFEYVEGIDLAGRLTQEPPPTLREALRMVRQTAEALDFAHAQGIVHRDIKPSNILLDRAGRVKVADFGIAKMVGQATELTVSGSVMGSPQYLSPEQIRGDELDGRSDVFSLGIVLYEMLSGRRPFAGETITTLVYQILHTEPPPISELRAIPPRLEDLLRRMLSKDKAGRIPSAAQVATELAAVERELDDETLSAPASKPLQATYVLPKRHTTAASVPPPPPGAPAAIPPPPPPGVQAAIPPLPPAGGRPMATGETGGGKRWLAIAAVLLLLVAMAAGGGFLLLNRGEEEPAPGPVAQGGGLGETPAPAPVLVEGSAETPAPAVPEPVAEPMATPAPASTPALRETVQPTPAPLRREVVVPETPRQRPAAALPAPTPVPPPPVEERTQGTAGTARTEGPEEGAAPAAPEPDPAAASADQVIKTGLEVAFRVTPPGAFVLLDRTSIGQAREWSGQKGARTYTLPGPGQYRVRLRAPGMREHRILIEASETGGTTPIVARLQPLPAADVDLSDLPVIQVREGVTFRVRPVGAAVLVDGQPAGLARRFAGGPLGGDFLKLTPGRHRVSVVAPGHRRYDVLVEVSAGAERARERIEVNLNQGGGE